jgi:hypothetical protein
MASGAGHRPRGCSTICLPFDQQAYGRAVNDPAAFRAALDTLFREMPELFPEAFAHGYLLKDSRVSKKLGLTIRRVECKADGSSFSVRPSFAMPYMAGEADDVADALFLRPFGVPFWALAKVFGKDHDYWYRLEVSLGRNSVAGTTLRRADPPEHLLADEHHQTRDGQKCYIATTVGAGCCLGAELAPTAGADDLAVAYGAFKSEAQDVQPCYTPETVSVDGWASTHRAWLWLFSALTLLRCFLHAWLGIRSRGKLHPLFPELSAKVWHAFHAPTRACFAQRMRRLREWAEGALAGAAWLLGEVRKMCGRAGEYGQAYDHPGGHRTSNMLDRVMRAMNRYLDDGQHLHGGEEACKRHARAWALLYNFRPWHPATAKKNGGWRCPAERLNEHRYHEDWLQNLLAHASLNGYRRRVASPQTP